ncbi:ABC transporter permease, partial [candidate division CSSED10-310 bacterium]
LAPVAYVTQTLDALVLKDLLSGLIKSIIFAWGIGMIGLYYGFQVRGGAEEVGRATTASVVASIFYIVVADCIFSIIFYVLT